MGKKRVTFQDYDPEDEFFGDQDNTRATTSSSLAKKSKNREFSSKGGEKEIPRNKQDLKFLRAALDEESLGKGIKTSRKELGFISSRDKEVLNEEEEEEMSDGYLESDELEFVDNDEKEEVTDDGNEEEDSLPSTNEILFKRPVGSDRDRGLQVKRQLKTWEQLLMVRYKLQPLVLTTNFPSNCISDLQQVEQDLLDFLVQDSEVPSKATLTESILAHVKRVLTDNHIQKANLKHFSPPDGWQQVQDIMANPNVLDKHCTRLFGDGDTLTDGDFLSKLLSSTSSTLNSQNRIATTSLLSFQKTKKHRPGADPKASKGRRLNYEVHDKLMGYMTPRRVDSLGSDTWWPQSRIDDLFRSLIH